MKKIDRALEEFRVCSPCLFEGECCVCKMCIKLRGHKFWEGIVKVANDFNDLKIVSFEIMLRHGDKSDHNEVLLAISKDQSEKAVILLSEVAMMIDSLLEKIDQKDFCQVDVTKAKKLVEKVDVFLNKSLDSCKETFNDFQEPAILAEVMKKISSATFFQTKSA